MQLLDQLRNQRDAATADLQRARDDLEHAGLLVELARERWMVAERKFLEADLRNKLEQQCNS